MAGLFGWTGSSTPTRTAGPQARPVRSFQLIDVEAECGETLSVTKHGNSVVIAGFATGAKFAPSKLCVDFPDGRERVWVKLDLGMSAHDIGASLAQAIETVTRFVATVHWMAGNACRVAILED